MKNRDRIFGLLAVLAVLIYMLACGTRPAWSPDSTRVVFAFYDRRAETTGLALYDLRTEQTSRIYETEEQVLFQPLWLDEKEQIIVLAAKEADKTLEIISLDLASGESRLIETFPAKEPQTALMIPPVLMDGRYLFFYAGLDETEPTPGLHRLDLKTERLITLANTTDRFLYKIGEEYFYLAGLEDAVELGTMNAKSLRFRRLATLDKQTYGEVIPSLAGSEKASSLAVVAGRGTKDQAQTDTERNDQDRFAVLILDRRGKLLKEIPLPAGMACTEATYCVFGPRDKSLWLPAVAPVKPKGEEEETNTEEYKFLLLEVDIERGSCCQVLEEHVGDEGGAHSMQPSISPDGKYLAVDVLVPKGEQNSLLYLVDLTDPERKVTKVSLPPKPTPTASPADEQ